MNIKTRLYVYRKPIHTSINNILIVISLSEKKRPEKLQDYITQYLTLHTTSDMAELFFLIEVYLKIFFFNYTRYVCKTKSVHVLNNNSILYPVLFSGTSTHYLYIISISNNVIIIIAGFIYWKL